MARYRRVTQEHRSPSSSNTTKLNYSLSEEEKKRVSAQYGAIQEEDKWWLKTGIVVEDKMKVLIEISSFEHTAHSMIMDPDDLVWKEYFSTDELNEIKSYNVKSLEKLPLELQECLNSYHKEWAPANELCEYAETKNIFPSPNLTRDGFGKA